MNRAKRRQQARKEKKSTATYNYTQAQLESKVRSSIEENLQKEHKAGFDEGYELGARDALVLMLGIPTEILLQEKGSEEGRKYLPGFLDKCLELYEQWMNDELDMEAIKQHLWEQGGIRLEVIEEQ